MFVDYRSLSLDELKVLAVNELMSSYGITKTEALKKLVCSTASDVLEILGVDLLKQYEKNDFLY